MDSIIINPFTPIPKSDKSHVKGWSLVWAQRLDSDIGDKDTNILPYKRIYIDHGVNFSGQLNLFGGFSNDVYKRCLDLILAKENRSEIISLDYGMFECGYEDQMKKRIGQNTSSEHLTIDFINQFEDVLDSCKTVTMKNIRFPYSLPKLIIGDSHCPAFSIPSQRIIKINGQTLYSALKQGLRKFIIHNFTMMPNEIDLCLGSVDIRHHVLRHDICPKQLAKQYANEVIQTQDYFETAINVCAPVPVEYEERKLPKTGQYNGTNFYGTREQRLNFTMKFIETLDSYCSDFDMVIPPGNWYNMDGKQYADEIMEMNSSVHIAPINYRSMLGWS